MLKKFLYISISLMMILALSVGIYTKPQTVHADQDITTTPWPTLLPGGTLYAHGDNSLTLAPTIGCTSQNTYIDNTPSIVTFNPDQSQDYSTPKNPDGWQVTECSYQRVVGSDGTTYFVQKNTTTQQQRLVAQRKGVILWTSSFSAACGNNSAQIFNPTLGTDGDIYVEIAQPDCVTGTINFDGLSAATGASTFSVALPSGSTRVGILNDDIMPYNNGVAIANGEQDIYYYDYSGEQDNSYTFVNPDTNEGSAITGAAITSDGRTYIATQEYVNGSWQYHAYYKDIDATMPVEITAPVNSAFVPPTISTTPNDGMAILLKHSGDEYLGYFDADGTLSYQDDLSSESGASLISGASFAVDNLGNAIVVRTMEVGSDHEVYVDSFSSTGTETRLFDSGAQFGTSGQDIFTTFGFTSQSIGNNTLYLELCHLTSFSGTWPTSCTDDGPLIVTIPTSSAFDYPRSDILSAQSQKLNYVALGDSYSSGEGNPPFIAPSDTDGCDRSPEAYAPSLAADLNYNLRAFVACSGATSDEVYTGMNGEPSQLNSLDSSTDIVTLTSGGDDVGFADFAEACVNPDPLISCDTNSSAYLTIMNNISSYLQDNLELLYSRIHTAAPNATVYVLGYPYVATLPTTAYCSYLTDSEVTAATIVTNTMNATISTAISDEQASGANFQFLDPNSQTVTSPFAGHDVCSNNSYFNNISWPTSYSFHPNQEGQAAWASWITDEIE